MFKEMTHDELIAVDGGSGALLWEITKVIAGGIIYDRAKYLSTERSHYEGKEDYRNLYTD